MHIILLIELLTLHMILCALVVFLSVFRLLAIRLPILPMVVLVPVFGPVCAFLLSLHKHLNRNKKVDINISHFQVEQEIYHSMGMPVEDGDVVSLEEALVINSSETRRSLMMELMRENVVPLEEALSISASDIRRKLMMDILTSDTAAFYSLLEQARMNEDVEVVHYATTAMSEINKQYDLMLQKYVDAWRSEPDNTDALIRYCDCMKQYLGMGLVRGQIEQVRRREYVDLLKELVARVPAEENYADLARQYMALQDFAAADALLNDMSARWPVSECTWLLRLEYHARRGDGAALQKFLRSASNSGIYFSAKAREQIRFWTGEKGEE